MKTKYSKQLIFNYINGEDITEYNIEDLENDTNFMIQVIEYTNDKKMYNFCGENVKNDYDFVKYLIKKFKDDIPFIIEIADKFKKNNSEDENFDCEELNIIISKILKNTNDQNELLYNLYINIFFSKVLVELAFERENDIELRNLDNYGLGFIIIELMFSERKIILDFFAKKLLEEIFFRNNNYKFEQLIHNDVKDIKTIKKQGINNYLINYIRKYDVNLAWYATCHIELLDDLKKEFSFVEKNWNNYLNMIYNRKVDIFIHELTKYYEENEEYYPDFNVADLIKYLIKKFNVEKYFKSNLDYITFFEDVDCSEFLNEQKPITDDKILSFSNLRCYNFAVSLLKELLNDNSIDEKKDDYLEPLLKQNAKILKIDFKKRSNN